MASRRRRRRSKSRGPRWLLWLFVVLAALFAGVWFARIPIAERVAIALVDRAGYGPATLTITRVDLDGAEIADVKFALGSIGQLAVDYRLSGDLTRIHVADADLDLSALPPQDEPEEVGLALPARTISVERVRVSAPMPGGQAIATVNGVVETVPVLSGQMDFALTTPTGDLTGRFRAGLQPDGGLKGALDIEGGALAFADIAISGATVAAAFESAEGGPVTSGTFSIDAGGGVRFGEAYAAEPAVKALAGHYELTDSVLKLEGLSGTFNVSQAEAAGLGQLKQGSLSLKPEGSTARYDLDEGAYSYALTTLPFALELLLEAGGEPAPVSLTGAQLSLAGDGSEMSVAVTDAGLSAPSHGIGVSGLNGSAKSEDDVWRVEAIIAALRHLGDPALITPLSAEIAGRLRDGLIEGKVAATHGTEPVALAFIIKHDLAGGTGEAAVTLDRVTLDDISIAALSPAYADTVTAPSGTVSFTGPIRWGPDGLGSDIAVSLDEIGFKSGTITVSALNGGLIIDSLMPPGTRPAQHLTAVLEIAPVGKMPIDLTFQLVGGKIEVENVDLSVFDGAITARAASFDAAKGAGGIDLQLTEIDLAAIFDLIDLEDVSGTGRVSGTLPVQIEGGRVAVTAGKLRAIEPGLLRLPRGPLERSLGGQNEDFDLAIEALSTSNFHYERLGLEADKPYTGVGLVKLKIEGANPDVQDGRPFVLNINLTSDFDNLARIFNVVASAVDKALQWGTQQGGR